MGLISCPGPSLLRHRPFSPSCCALASEGLCLALLRVDGFILGLAALVAGGLGSGRPHVPVRLHLGLQCRRFSAIMAPSLWLPSCVLGTPPLAQGGLWHPGLRAGHCWHSGWPAALAGLSRLCTASAASPAPPSWGPQCMSPAPSCEDQRVSRLCHGSWHEAPFSPTDLLLQGPLASPLLPAAPPSTCRLSAPPLPSTPSTPCFWGQVWGGSCLPREPPPPLTHFLLIRGEV